MAKDGELLRQIHRPLPHECVERSAFQELHDDVLRAFLFDQLVDGNDVGMLELSDRPRFSNETKPELGVGREIGGHRLDGHLSSEARVDGAIHDAHGTVAQDGYDVVLPDFFWTCGRHSIHRGAIFVPGTTGTNVLACKSLPLRPRLTGRPAVVKGPRRGTFSDGTDLMLESPG